MPFVVPNLALHDRKKEMADPLDGCSKIQWLQFAFPEKASPLHLLVRQGMEFIRQGNGRGGGWDLRGSSFEGRLNRLAQNFSLERLIQDSMASR